MPLNLHIGLPKTGTTYIQKKFHHASTKISDDIKYPNFGFYNHQLAMYKRFLPYLPWSRSTGSKDEWGKLRSVLKDSKENTLISAEAFSALNREGVKKLSELLKETEIKSIMITVRPMNKLLPSFWQQNLKSGGTIDMKKYVNETITLIESNEYPCQMFAYYDSIELWKRFFNDAPFEILFMDGSKEQNLRKFANILDLSDESIETLVDYSLPDSEHNLSLSEDECVELIKLNKMIDVNNASISDRTNMIEACFQRRSVDKVYKTPTIDAETLKRVQTIDRAMHEKSKRISNCRLHYGSSAAE